MNVCMVFASEWWSEVMIAFMVVWDDVQHQPVRKLSTPRDIALDHTHDSASSKQPA
jgi:hypothetical protein